ncbi:MAG: hypothetical protein LBF77_03530, partial [Spirochaetaceae bacterium]|nr:hypothetical protein [Spirochaetaceae bacterium]
TMVSRSSRAVFLRALHSSSVMGIKYLAWQEDGLSIIHFREKSRKMSLLAGHRRLLFYPVNAVKLAEF